MRMMRTIIAGSRTIEQYDLVKTAIESCNWHLEITEVVSGCAEGADLFGEQWARRKMIPIKRFPADWRKHGRRAGPIRNEEMANYADALIAVRKGGTASKGTTDMIERARYHRLRVFIYDVMELV